MRMSATKALAILGLIAVFAGNALAQSAPGAAAEESVADPGKFKIGVATSFHTNVGVPSDRLGANVMMGGVFWRYRVVDWFLVGGGIYVGSDVGDVGADLRSIRFEIISTVFDIPVSRFVRPYMRIGLGVQTETFTERDFGLEPGDEDYPYHGDGLFGLAAPGVAFQPLRWLHIYLEFQSTVLAGGAPLESDSAVQLGGELGVGVSF
jgi:hypothetical protein